SVAAEAWRPWAEAYRPVWRPLLVSVPRPRPSQPRPLTRLARCAESAGERRLSSCTTRTIRSCGCPCGSKDRARLLPSLAEVKRCDHLLEDRLQPSLLVFGAEIGDLDALVVVEQCIPAAHHLACMPHAGIYEG